VHATHGGDEIYGGNEILKHANHRIIHGENKNLNGGDEILNGGDEILQHVNHRIIQSSWVFF